MASVVRRAPLCQQILIAVLQMLRYFFNDAGFARQFKVQMGEAPAYFVFEFRHSPSP